VSFDFHLKNSKVPAVRSPRRCSLRWSLLPPSMPVSSSVAAVVVLYAANLHCRSSPCTVPHHLSTPGFIYYSVSSRMWLFWSDCLECDCLIIMCFKIIIQFHKFRNMIIVAWNVIAWLLCALKLLFDFISLGMWLLLLGMWLLDYYVLQNYYSVS
jgi:hypothetical protein